MTKNTALLYITCFCGLSRLLPEDFKGRDGEKITLAPCPRCGAGFSGICQDGRIEVDN